MDTICRRNVRLLRLGSRLTRVALALIPTGVLLARPAIVAAADPDPCAQYMSSPQQYVVCKAGQGITNIPGDVAGAAVGFAADQAERALTQWVVDAAVWLLNQLGNVVFNTASPVLSADWFRAHYADMVAVAWVVAPLFLILGVIQAIVRADLAVLGRMAGQLAFVAIFTLGAVSIAQLLIGTVDQLSDFVSRNAQNDLHDFLTNTLGGTMTIAMSTSSINAVPAGQPPSAMLPMAFVFLSAVMIVLGSALIWLELLARTLVIYAALLFFPVLLAAAIWPRLSHVLHRFVELLVAVIVSKFIIVVIVAAGVAAIRAMNGQGQGPALLVGAGLLLLAAWAPWKFYRLLPLMEAGVLHHAAEPFQSGWHRIRTQGWRTTRSTVRSTTHRSGGGTLPIAGRRPPTATRTAGAAGAAAGGAAAAATVATAGARAAGRRLAGGGQGPAGGSGTGSGQPRRPGGPGAAGAPAGWRTVRVAGGGSIHVPGDRVRNPRSTGGGAGG
jgi:type IV secretion system protein TrbL